MVTRSSHHSKEAIIRWAILKKELLENSKSSSKKVKHPLVEELEKRTASKKKKTSSRSTVSRFLSRQ